MEDIKDILKRLSSECETEFKENILPYWYTYSIDEENGGFYGAINSSNEGVETADKGAIFNARILWTFSASYRLFGDVRSAEMAHRAYQYLINNFYDHTHGGIYWMLNADGEISDDKKHVYVQGFGIYGLVEYYAAFGDKDALKYAETMMKLIEDHCADQEFGGYFESFSRNWKLNEDVRLSDKDLNAPKSMNTHLHVLEAYTNLYRYKKDQNTAKRLEQLIEIFLDHILDKEKRSLHCFFDSNWEPVSNLKSFGHNIEASWLLMEAANVLDIIPLKSRILEVVEQVGEDVLKNGTDKDGGIINEIEEGDEPIGTKDWWPQAEALVGYINAYECTGDQKFIAGAENIWRYIHKVFIDAENGEWFEQVSASGIPLYDMNKAYPWKAPYHNGRAMFEVYLRGTELLKKEELLGETVKSGVKNLKTP